MSSKVRNVIIHTDGACSGNPGPGGWAAILEFGKARKEITGSSPDTTNNRMELEAVVNALSALTEPCSVVIKSDSRYVVTCLGIYMHDWVKREWRKSDGDMVKHADLSPQQTQVFYFYPLPTIFFRRVNHFRFNPLFGATDQFQGHA